MDFLAGVEPHWIWLGLGLVLAIGEMVIPGVFLIWLSGAALLTGVAAWLLPISGAIQIVMFAVLAVISLFMGRRYLRDHPIVPADPAMNDRGARMVGETVIVTHAIDGGSGKVRVGDSDWMARGPDAEPGTRMRVRALQGSVLIVEYLH